MCVCVCIIYYIKKSNEKISEKLACPGLKKMSIIGIQMVSIKICQAKGKASSGICANNTSATSHCLADAQRVKVSL